MTPGEAVDVGRVFHALGDPTRRAILGRLSLAPSSVSALAGPLGVTVTAIGQHLQVLEDSRLVTTRKSGRTRTCRIEPAGFTAVERWIGHHRMLWEQRLDRIGEALDEG